MGNYSSTNAQSSHHSRAKAVSQRAPGNKSLVGPRRCLGKKQNTCEYETKNPYALGCACL